MLPPARPNDLSREGLERFARALLTELASFLATSFSHGELWFSENSLGGSLRTVETDGALRACFGVLVSMVEDEDQPWLIGVTLVCFVSGARVSPRMLDGEHQTIELTYGPAGWSSQGWQRDIYGEYAGYDCLEAFSDAPWASP